jgi:hypothetical protein
VPEEFADVYRAAYERAMAEQTDAPTHRERPAEDAPEDDDQESATDWSSRLPSRQGRLLVGTHRGAAPESGEPDAGSVLDRLRESRAFVPVLLVLLVLVMVVGAYLLGRVFAAQVSSSNVMGPSPTSVTSICAPNEPVSTCTPASRNPVTTAS